MKSNHGNIITIFIVALLAISSMGADGFSSNFTISKNDPYIKEPIILKLNIEQSDHSKVMLFKFSPKKSDKYEFYRLDIKEQDDYHAVKIEYIYIIYPLATGVIDIEFDLLQMVTTDEKVAYSFSGDRDNIKGLNKVDIPISLPPLILSVNPIPNSATLVGDFQLSYKIEKKEMKAYEPIPITITIKGEGYPPIIKDIIPKSQNYSIFGGESEVKSIRGVDSVRSSVTYTMALSAKESFELPTIKIDAFDPKKRRSYQLTIPKESFRVIKPKIDTLIDRIDNPKPIDSDWGWLTTLIGYIITFIAGFITAKSLKWRYKEKYIGKEDEFSIRVDSIDDPKELLQLLLSTDSQRYYRAIDLLESMIYNKKRVSLNQIKKEIRGQ